MKSMCPVEEQKAEIAPVGQPSQPADPVIIGEKEEKKPMKEKKLRVLKEKKSKTPNSQTPYHPTYFQMIKEAITGLNEKGGSSPYAIAKHMEEKYKSVLPANYRKIMTIQLRNCVTKGKLVRVKGSFKLSNSRKKAVSPKKEKNKEGAEVKRKNSMGATKAKSSKKKSTPTKAKQPKSIKSPAAKRAKKVAAST